MAQAEGALVMDRAPRARPRRRPASASVGTSVRRVPVSDLLVLTAIGRAECHNLPQRVLWGDIALHLGLEASSATTTRLRPLVGVLVDAGEVIQSSHGGYSTWALTEQGRDRLKNQRGAAKPLELPESPQHREWRQARAQAASELHRIRDQLGATLKLALSELSDERSEPEAWRATGKSLGTDCTRLASAYFCVHKWPEPDDTQRDTNALSEWSRALARGTANAGPDDPVAPTPLASA
jgi:hypothetical protein